MWRRMHFRALMLLSGLLPARLAYTQSPSFASADGIEITPDTVACVSTERHATYSNPYFLEQKLLREVQKPSGLRMANLRLPRPRRKPAKMTWGNFMVSPGVQAFDIPDNWINGTSNIHVVNVLFNFARRLHLFKPKQTSDDDDGR
jgi:hypothetical protein